MQEFEFIKECLDSDTDRSLLMGIGDDAAVIMEHQELCHLQVEIEICQLNINSHKSIANNIACLKSLLESNKFPQPRLFINLSLATLNRKGIKLYLTALYKLLESYNTILAGGDTTQGSGTVIYQIVGYKPDKQ